MRAAFLELNERRGSGAAAVVYVRMDLIAAVRPNPAPNATSGSVLLLIPAGRELRVEESPEEVLGRIEEAAVALSE